MSSILKTAQPELCKHDWDTFVDNPPSIARGGNGVVVPGCTHCRKTLNTTNQFIEHLANDVLPQILHTALTTTTKFVYCQDCKAVVEYEKVVLESDGRTGAGDRLHPVPLRYLHVSRHNAYRFRRRCGADNCGGHARQVTPVPGHALHVGVSAAAL